MLKCFHSFATQVGEKKRDGLIRLHCEHALNLKKNPSRVADPGISKSRGGHREFMGGGVEIFFYAPWHIPYGLAFRVESKIHAVYIAFWLQLNYMRVMNSKFTKTNQKFLQTGGARPVQLCLVRVCSTPLHIWENLNV